MNIPIRTAAPLRLVIPEDAITTNKGANGLEIYIPGYRQAPDGEGTQIYLEIYNGHLRVYVWDGGDDPAAVVTIERKAKQGGKNES